MASKGKGFAYLSIGSSTYSYIDEFIDNCREKQLYMTKTSIPTEIFPSFQKYHCGKVRDSYICEDLVVIITTDRQSAFDRQLAAIPYKGQVLNLISNWWFDQTKALVPNHKLLCPHPNVTIAKRCTVFPVEFVMRGYMTGSTNTSMWTNYSKGVRLYCGHKLPEGMTKNQKLERNLLTPTTKDDSHDELISAEEIVSTGRMTQSEWDTCAQYAHTLFNYGQIKALERGLILVDTKYEFGKDVEGNILLIDEIHTPDSSRYWISESYLNRFSEGLVRLLRLSSFSKSD
jgi:phosphoribosylaminoimidazole-succinocarboxamide synthase